MWKQVVPLTIHDQWLRDLKTAESRYYPFEPTGPWALGQLPIRATRQLLAQDESILAVLITTSRAHPDSREELGRTNIFARTRPTYRPVLNRATGGITVEHTDIEGDVWRYSSIYYPKN